MKHLTRKLVSTASSSTRPSKFVTIKVRYFSTANAIPKTITNKKQESFTDSSCLFPDHSILTQDGSDVLARLLAEHESNLTRVHLGVSDTGQPLSSDEIGKLSIEIEKFREKAEVFKQQQNLLQSWRECKSEVMRLEHLCVKQLGLSTDDRDLKNLYSEEIETIEETLESVEEKIADLMLIEECEIDQKNAILEVKAAVGGLEASLFAKEIFDVTIYLCIHSKNCKMNDKFKN